LRKIGGPLASYAYFEHHLDLTQLRSLPAALFTYADDERRQGREIERHVSQNVWTDR
jgi:hypothetical protein